MTLFGQSGNVQMLSVEYHHGFIISHSSAIKEVSSTKPFGFEVDYAWHLTKEESWKYCFCYPKTGLSFQYTNFNYPDVLGSSFALYAFIEPYLNAGNKFGSSFRFGVGPTYLNRVYHEVNNPTNKFYSSPISFLVKLKYSFHYVFKNNNGLQLEFSVNHISNGGIKNPNKGINYPTLGIKYNHYLHPITFEHRKKDKSEKLINYKNRFDITGFATGKTVVKGHEKYLVTGTSLKYLRTIGRINAFALELEATSDFADKNEILRDSALHSTDHKYLSVAAGHEWIFGKFNFGISLGAYFYSPFKRMDPVYHRWNLTYNFIGNWFAGVNLKAHRHVADFLDMRIGYSIKLE